MPSTVIQSLSARDSQHVPDLAMHGSDAYASAYMRAASPGDPVSSLPSSVQAPGSSNPARHPAHRRFSADTPADFDARGALSRQHGDAKVAVGSSAAAATPAHDASGFACSAAAFTPAKLPAYRPLADVEASAGAPCPASLATRMPHLHHAAAAIVGSSPLPALPRRVFCTPSRCSPHNCLKCTHRAAQRSTDVAAVLQTNRSRGACQSSTASPSSCRSPLLAALRSRASARGLRAATTHLAAGSPSRRVPSQLPRPMTHALWTRYWTGLRAASRPLTRSTRQSSRPTAPPPPRRRTCSAPRSAACKRLTSRA